MENSKVENVRVENIRKKQLLPLWAVRMILAVSFLFSTFFDARSSVYMLSVNPLMNEFFVFGMVDVLFYFLFAGFYYGMFELVMLLFFRFQRFSPQYKNPILYLFMLLYSACNILAFGFRMIYLAFPPFKMLGDAVFVPIIYFLGLFTFYFLLIKKKTLPSVVLPRVISSSAYLYFGITLILTVVTLMTEVMA